MKKSGDIFSSYHLVERCANGIKWVEATDTAKYPTAYRIFSTTKNYLAGSGSVSVCSHLNCTCLLAPFFCLAPCNPGSEPCPFFPLLSHCGVFITSCTCLVFFQMLSHFLSSWDAFLPPPHIYSCLLRHNFCVLLAFSVNLNNHNPLISHVLTRFPKL